VRSERAIVALIEREEARGIPAERIVLAGFSQGCADLPHTGLRLPRRLAGIMALSGYLPLADRLAAERHTANAGTRVFMAHGTHDPVVVIARGEASRDALTALGKPSMAQLPDADSLHPREIADTRPSW
jgi:phospholipase/carboxylesterase